MNQHESHNKDQHDNHEQHDQHYNHVEPYSQSNHNPYKEEASAELAVPVSYQADRREQEQAEDVTAGSAGQATGWAAIILAALSWLIWPAILGITAAVTGFIAYRQGSRALGSWAIAGGLIAAAVYLILVPLYYAIA